MSQTARHVSLTVSALVLALAWSATAYSAAPAWPQFRGPNRDGKSAETGLLKQWPEGGPKLLWQMTGLGRGYSSVSIVDGRLYTMGDLGAGKASDKEQMLLCIDLASRKLLWSTRVGPPHKDGPRCVPTVDGNRVYAVGTDGDLVCADAASGKVVWRKNFVKDFGGKMMSGWRYSESPLVDGNKLVCTPGGNDAVMVALHKETGDLIWKCALPKLGDRGGDGAGYSSIVAADIEGVRQYVQLVGRGVIGVEAASGKFLWGYNRVANKIANITSPLVHGNYVFCTTSYKTGSALLKISRDKDQMKAEEVYWLDFETFANHHGGVVLVDKHLYGGDGQNNGTPVCLEMATGKVAWKDKPVGGKSAAVLYADGNLIFRYENGVVALIEARPDAFRVNGQFQTPSKSGPAWPYPVILDKKLYLRDNDVLMCYDLAG